MLTTCEWCGAPLGGSMPPNASIGETYPVAPASRPSESREWYASPWPYLVAIAVLLSLIGAALAFSNRKAETYSQLVVEGRPTLLDVYTDT